MHPLFGYRPPVGRLISTAAADARSAHRRLDRLGDDAVDRFPVKITAYDTVTGSYTWTRQLYAGAGVYYDHPSGMNGGPSGMQLVERNGLIVDGPGSFPHYAMVDRRGLLGGPMYEFDATEHKEEASGAFASGVMTPGAITPLLATLPLTAQIVGRHFLGANLLLESATTTQSGRAYVSFGVTAGTAQGYPSLRFGTYVPSGQPLPPAIPFDIGAVVHVSVAPCTFSMSLDGRFLNSGGIINVGSTTIYLVSV